MYLIDTNICIFVIKRRPAAVLDVLRKNAKRGIYISSLTIAELEYRAENSKQKDTNRIALLKLLSLFDI